MKPLDLRRCKKTSLPWLWILVGALVVVHGCTTTKRTAQLVVDHHVGMVRGAVDIVTGEAEAREKRLAQLRTKLEESRAALSAEQDPQRSLELLKQHIVLQDALIAELLHAQGHHHGCEHAKSDADKKQGEHEH